MPQIVIYLLPAVCEVTGTPGAGGAPDQCDLSSSRTTGGIVQRARWMTLESITPVGDDDFERMSGVADAAIEDPRAGVAI